MTKGRILMTHGHMFNAAGPEYGIRRDGKTFGMTCLSLKDAEEMAGVLRQEGGKIEIFVLATGQIVANEASQAEEAGRPAPQNSAPQ
jgi:hypothetical protein